MPHFDLVALLKTVSYVGIFAIIFAESGLLIGFFLPGDTLLFTAGLLASQGYFEIQVLLPLCFIAAVTGDAVGYSFGHRVGRRLFDQPNSFWFRRHHLEAAEAFFEKHGGKAVVLARFVPVVRTFTPIVAGAAAMPYRRFAFFNFAGGLLWAVGVTLCGYVLGEVIPDPDRYLLPIVALIFLASVAPGAIHFWRDMWTAR